MGKVATGITLAAAVLLVGCTERDEARSVVVYTSVDQPHAEPILRRFEARTGIRARAVYDVEAAKTTGLVNRLIAERAHPQADVFWNGELAQTLLLKERGILAPQRTAEGTSVPRLCDAEGYWSAFGGRARVLLINTEHLTPAEYPASLFDLVEPRWPGERIGIAYPLFGTTATHAAALYAVLGALPARRFFQQLKERGVRVLDGNAGVRDWVASGRLSVGLTDTDDACAAVTQGAPVAVVVPDQGPAGLGTLIIPNTVALVAGAPHPREGQELIDYLLDGETTRALIDSGWIQAPLDGATKPPACLGTDRIKPMAVELHAIYENLPRAQRELGELYLR